MAEVVEITMEKDEPRVHRVVAVVDCGQVVNPSILEQQIQGGIVYGLANALRAKITIEKGRVVQGNFDDYAPLRMDETPAVEVYAVPSAEAPTGIGEPSVPPIAPALCNAIYAATKKRIRALPILELGSRRRRGSMPGSVAPASCADCPRGRLGPPRRSAIQMSYHSGGYHDPHSGSLSLLLVLALVSR